MLQERHVHCVVSRFCTNSGQNGNCNSVLITTKPPEFCCIFWFTLLHYLVSCERNARDCFGKKGFVEKCHFHGKANLGYSEAIKCNFEARNGKSGSILNRIQSSFFAHCILSCILTERYKPMLFSALESNGCKYKPSALFIRILFSPSLPTKMLFLQWHMWWW